MEGFFDNVKFVPKMGVHAITGQRVAIVDVEYKCEKCGKWFPKNQIANYNIPVSVAGVPEVQKSTFICNICNSKETKNE